MYASDDGNDEFVSGDTPREDLKVGLFADRNSRTVLSFHVVNMRRSSTNATLLAEEPPSGKSKIFDRPRRSHSSSLPMSLIVARCAPSERNAALLIDHGKP